MKICQDRKYCYCDFDLRFNDIIDIAGNLCGEDTILAVIQRGKHVYE